MNIKDIARRAGVSTATVSRALNSPEKVSQDTLDRVMKVVDELNYSINPFAKNLASPTKTNNILLISPNSNNPYFYQLAKGANSFFAEYDYFLHTYSAEASLNNYDKFIETVNNFGTESFFDGIILAANILEADKYNRTLPHVKKPMVLMEYVSESTTFDSVLVDEKTGIWLAFEYLNRKGYKSLGIVHGGEDYQLTKRKLKYIKELHKEFEIELCENWIIEASYDSIEDSYTIVSNQISVKKDIPSVFFCFNDLIALATTRVLLDKGLKIPKDVGVLGTDDISFSKFVNPRLTTIKTPTEELGRTAARVLLNKMTNPSLPPQRIFLPPTLIIRESC